MTYLGAFGIPNGGCGNDRCTGNFGGTALAFDPAGNGGRGSLWFAALNSKADPSHSYQTPSVAEISVENDLVNGLIDPTDAALSQMPTAKLVQPFGDVFAGRSNEVSPASTNWIGGLAVAMYQGVPRLIGTIYNSFGVASTGKSHFILTKSTTAPAVITGPFEVNGTGVSPTACGGGRDCPDGWVAGSTTAIPAAYQTALGGDVLSGACCMSLIGRTSLGPTATRWRLADAAIAPVIARRLVAYPSNHPTLGQWITNGESGGTGQFTSQNDFSRFVWPQEYRSLLFFYRLGNPHLNCYGSPVAGDADGDPVMNATGEQQFQGVDASTDATGTVITLPNVNVASIGIGGPLGYLWLSSQSSPAFRYGGRNYQGLARLVSTANSGTPTASVTVAAANAFPPNLTAQPYRVAAPACYDPAEHGNASPDNLPKGGHTPTAYPYTVLVYGYDANDLAAVNAGTKQPWDLLPYATWPLPLPVNYPGGKYATNRIGAVAIDQAGRKIYVTQVFAGANGATIVLVYQIAPS